MEFYALFHKGIYNSCLRILNDSMDAEEVMQETLIKFFDRVEDFNLPYADLERKLKRIAINASIDVLRQRKVFFTPIDENFDCVDAEPEQPENPAGEITIDMVQDAIQILPNGYRMIVNLRLIEDMSFEQIADTLHITSSTARSQFVRARKKLVTLIKEQLYESVD